MSGVHKYVMVVLSAIYTYAGASETVAAQLLELLGPEAAEHISDLIEQR
jgi:predicted branched-subunit amino acid permease